MFKRIAPATWRALGGGLILAVAVAASISLPLAVAMMLMTLLVAAVVQYGQRSRTAR